MHRVLLAHPHGRRRRRQAPLTPSSARTPDARLPEPSGRSQADFRGRGSGKDAAAAAGRAARACSPVRAPATDPACRGRRCARSPRSRALRAARCRLAGYAQSDAAAEAWPSHGSPQSCLPRRALAAPCPPPPPSIGAALERPPPRRAVCRTGHAAVLLWRDCARSSAAAPAAGCPSRQRCCWGSSAGRPRRAGPCASSVLCQPSSGSHAPNQRRQSLHRRRRRRYAVGCSGAGAHRPSVIYGIYGLPLDQTSATRRDLELPPMGAPPRTPALAVAAGASATHSDMQRSPA